MKNYSLNRILVLFVAAGFIFLMVDTILEHSPVLSQEPFAFIPIIFSGICAVIGSVTFLRWKESLIRLLGRTLIAAFLVSAVGMYFHLIEEDPGTMTTEEERHEQRESRKPPLAPLAFGGLAAVGLLATSRKWPSEPRP